MRPSFASTAPPSRRVPRWRAALGAAVVVLSLLAAATGARAATRDFFFKRLGTEQGLTQNTVTALLQDPQGFVWVGTQGGLHRYDGHRYVVYRHDPRDPDSLPDSYITALALGGRDSLWIGSYSGYVSRLDLGSGRVRRYPLGEDTPQAERQVMALLPQGERLWVGTLAGLEWFEPATGRRGRVLQLSPSQVRAEPFQQLLADRAGRIWFASAGGLFRIDNDGNVARIGAPAVTRSLLLDEQGQLWIGRVDGLYRLHRSGAQLVRAWTAPRADVRAIAQAPDGRLWLSVWGRGLRRFDPDSGRSDEISEVAALEAGLSENLVNSLMVDRGGMLWVGGQFRGVAVADPRGTRFRYVFDLDPERTGPPAADDSVRALLEGGDGTLWVATDSARLLRYHLAADRFEDWTGRLPPLPAGEPQRRVLAMGDAGHERVWLATNRGLLRLDPAAGTIEPIALGPYSDANLRSLLVDAEGDLWLGTVAQGALHYERESGRVVRYGPGIDDPHRLPHPTVHALLQDRRGRIWFGTGGGLALLDPATGRLRQFSHDPTRPGGLGGHIVRALHEAADGTVWVGTHTGLSQVVEQADGRIGFLQPLAEALGHRPLPVVFSITESPGGLLWLGTDAGIVRFDPARGSARAYGLADGLQDLEFNGGAVASLRDGRRAFGGVRGFNLFDPARMRGPAYTAPVHLLAARIGADAPSSAGTLWTPQPLRLPAGADILRLRIGALDYAPNAHLGYRYRLDGFDKGWIDNGDQPDITYTRLPPGRYTFRAQARQHDGDWSGPELRVPVIVAPPVWRHPLVIAAVVLLGLALLAAWFWRWRRQRGIEQGWYAQIREREERLKLALWASGEQFWDYDLVGGRMHRMRVDDEDGPTPEIGVQTLLEQDHEIHPDDLPQVLERLRRHLRGEVALFLSEHRIRRPDGDWMWVRARGRVVERGADGRARRVAGTARDITASRVAERERRIASEVLRSMAEAVVVFDRDFVFTWVNPAFTHTTGYTEAEVAGRPTSLLDSLQHDPAFHRDMRAALQRDGRWSGEIWQQRKDGREFLCWVQASVVLDTNGQRGHYVAVLSDITEQKRAEQELRYLANYDTLTGLPNRTLLSERLSRAIVRARRAHHKVAVLFLDLDRFKHINDSLGHAAGDRILRAAAARLQETAGIQHTVARLGGDEFTVVLEHLESAEQADAVARDLLAAFEAPLDFDERHDLAISPSIGISLYPDHGQTPTDLLKHADTAMYQAKAVGRRTFMRYDGSMDADIHRRATISAALRKVLDRDELKLVFQPRLSLRDSRITGVEALLRWHSAEHGEIEPAQFIGLAEETGLILEIGEWALREACLQLRRWRQQGQRGLSMAVNVSALQLLRGDLPEVVARVLDDTGVPADRLELELTETVVMANAVQTAATLDALRALGVRLAIDDFGTGYSSLAYLKRLPIQTLKIDKAFIADLARDPDDEAITATVITMGRSLGLTVVAEGVETRAQLQFLRDHGCDEIQGYWLARPLEPEACLAFIGAWEPAPGPGVTA